MNGNKKGLRIWLYYFYFNHSETNVKQNFCKINEIMLFFMLFATSGEVEIQGLLQC